MTIHSRLDAVNCSGKRIQLSNIQGLEPEVITMRPPLYCNGVMMMSNSEPVSYIAVPSNLLAGLLEMTTEN